MPKTKATGPRTPEGKAASGQNALRHGLTSAQIVLPGESASDFEGLRRSLVEAHRPAPGVELMLVDQIAQCLWRLNRARRFEQEAVQHENAFNPDSIAAARLERILRYTAAIERELHRSTRELTATQAARARTAAAESKVQARQDSARMDQEIHELLAAPIPGVEPLTAEYCERILNGSEPRHTDGAEHLPPDPIPQNCETNSESGGHPRAFPSRVRPMEHMSQAAG